MDAPIDVSTSEIRNFLSRRLGEKEAAEIMTYIKKEIDKEVSLKVDAARNEIILWREEMNKVFASRDAYEKMQVKLIKRVSGAESTLILWAFVFWLTQLAVIFYFFKFYR